MKRRRLPNGEVPLVTREARWTIWLSFATGVLVGFLFGSLALAGMATVAAMIAIDGATRIWEDIEVIRGNDPYAERRAEMEFLREERLRREQDRQRRIAARRERFMRLCRWLRRRKQ